MLVLFFFKFSLKYKMISCFFPVFFNIALESAHDNGQTEPILSSHIYELTLYTIKGPCQ